MKKIIFLSMILSFFVLFGFVDQANALEKTEIANIELEGFTAPSYGDELIKDMNLSIISPSGVLRNFKDNTRWEYYNDSDDTWYWIGNPNDVYAQSGKYRYVLNYYIDDTSRYIFSDNVIVKVDGNNWNNVSVYNSNNSINITSPEFIINSPDDNSVHFFDSHNYDLPTYIYSGEKINSFSVSNTVDSGTKPYKFSKTSGPEWLIVAEDGTISGTVPGLNNEYKHDNGDAVITVTDAENRTASITINCGITIDQQNLADVGTINLSGFQIPQYDNYYHDIKQIIPDNNNVLIEYYKSYIRYSDKTNTQDIPFYNVFWRDILSETHKYSEGSYGLVLSAVVSANDGYKVTENTKFILNGKVLKNHFGKSSDGKYHIEVIFPYYKVLQDKTVLLHEVMLLSKCPTDEYGFWNIRMVEDEKTLDKIEDLKCDNYVFGGWYKDESFNSSFDFNELIKSDLQLYPKWQKTINNTNTSVTNIVNKIYNGRNQTQSVKVVFDNKTLKNGTDYIVSYKNNKNVGTATITITGTGNYIGTITKTFKINKANNPLAVKTYIKSVYYSKVKSKAQVVKPITISKWAGTVTYSKLSGSTKLTINRTTGKVTVKKSTKRGIYRIKVKILASGNTNYKSGYTIRTITVKVK